MKLQKPNPSAFEMMFFQLIVLFSIKILCLQPTNIIVNALGSESDRLALLEFRKGIANDPLGVLTSWNDSTSFCSWHGVTCSHRRERVIALDLQEHGLRGFISPHVGNLTFLRRMDLGNNSFYGKIPPDVGRLYRLKYLSLSYNTFIGEVPTQLLNCSQLRALKFRDNKLVGRIPPEIGSLTKLERLLLGLNNLTGSIPPSIGNLSSLRDFWVPFNNLEGIIPDDIGRLENLIMLEIAGNKLSGMIPASLYNISSISHISVGSNKLNGTLPTSIGHKLPKLKFLANCNNDFSGPIPLSLSNASKLYVVNLSENNFVGVVPRDFGKLVSLLLLGFSENYLGSNSSDDLNFLESLKNISQLKILQFGGNQFGGVLPTSIANLSSQLSRLDIGRNQIYESIPPTLEKYTNLNFLDMYGNLFTGIIPSSFGKLQNMRLMDLSGNNLTGQIPLSFGNLTRLLVLILATNNLNGRIPPSVGNCKNLQYLDISQNSLTGAIPKEVIGLSSLSLLLNLSQNSLTNNLPVNIGNLKNINSLDLSENNLFGEIPTTISSCESLEYISLRGNTFRGVIPSDLAALKGLTHLDLSQNNFSGTIPKELQNLRYLLYFNASFNDLEGEMPTKGVFGNSTAISILGNNKLCGGVPVLKLPACPDHEKETKHGISQAMKLIIIIILVVLGLLFPSLLAVYWKRKSKKIPPAEESDPFHLFKVSYKMLYDGTRGFSPSNLIGSGSFGSVYKGILNQDERAVAIKVFNLQKRGASKSFMAECMALKNARHRNLVKIITSCSSIDYHGNDFKAMVFEFMENSSLEEWLHLKKDCEDPSKKLNILQRLNAAIDVASAIHYLHSECEQPIVHCDLKPSNVLLDNDMVAHVGDFGLARILPTTNGTPQNQSSTIGLKGSIGYAAPEYGMGGEASIQGDVYSYGILLLEMFTGKRPTDEVFGEELNIHQYTKMALPERLKQIVDPSLLVREVEVATSSENPIQMNANMEKCLQSALEIGLACSVEPPKERMKMRDVISKLLLIKNDLVGALNNRFGIRNI